MRHQSSASIVSVVNAGTETVYGEPQHGLLLGMCIFAGICLLGIVLLFRDTPIEENREVNREQQPKAFTRTPTNYPQ